MRLLLIGITLLLLSGCLSEPDCQATAGNQVQFRFRDSVSNKLVKVLFSSIRISSNGTVLEKTLTMTTPPAIDSLLTVSLPVNSFTKQTTYIFNYGVKVDTVFKSKTDSIRVTYDVQNIIVSTECGLYIYCSNLVVPFSSFKHKPRLLNNQLSTSETVNIELVL